MEDLVVDASVAAKWLVGGPDAEQALKVLQGADSLSAPDFILVELGNVLWKVESRAGSASTVAVPDLTGVWLAALPIELTPAQSILARALDLTFRYGRSVYDSLYLALAVIQEQRMVTADRRLVRALSGTELAPLVVDLAEFDPFEPT